MNRDSLWAALAVIAGTILALLVVAVVRKTVRVVQVRRYARIQAAARPALLALLDGQSLPASLRGGVADAVDELAVQALGTVRGEAASHLEAHLRSRGVAERMSAHLGRMGAIRRGRAAEVLGALRAADAVPALTRALRDRSPEVRQIAARALGRVGGRNAAIALFAALDGPRSLPAGQAAMALVTIGAATIGPARDALGSHDPTVRYIAAQLLGHLKALDAVPDLAAHLGRADLTELRAELATALGRIGSPAATPALLAACDAAEPEVVRASAATALGRIGADAAIPTLTAMLREPGYAVPHAAALSLAAMRVAGRTELVRAVAAGGDASGHAAEALALGHR